MSTNMENPFSKIIPASACPRCFDTGIWLTPENVVSDCSYFELGWHFRFQTKSSEIVVRAARRLNEMQVWISPTAFDLARILTHYTTEKPCPRPALIECFYFDTPFSESNKLRKFHALIEELRNVWLLPVGSRKFEPCGYWIITNLDDYKAWVNRAKSAPVTQLTTIHKNAKSNYPLYAEQLELEFWQDVEGDQ